LDLRRSASPRFQEQFRANLLGGIVVLKHPGAANENSVSGSKLYSSYTAAPAQAHEVELQFIPYYAWANRAPTPMQVWTPYLRA